MRRNWETWNTGHTHVPKMKVTSNKQKISKLHWAQKRCFWWFCIIISWTVRPRPERTILLSRNAWNMLNWVLWWYLHALLDVKIIKNVEWEHFHLFTLHGSIQISWQFTNQYSRYLVFGEILLNQSHWYLECYHTAARLSTRLSYLCVKGIPEGK